MLILSSNPNSNKNVVISKHLPMHTSSHATLTTNNYMRHTRSKQMLDNQLKHQIPTKIVKNTLETNTYGSKPMML